MPLGPMDQNQQPDITKEVQQLLGSKDMVIVQKDKQIEQLQAMCSALEKENKDLKK